MRKRRRRKWHRRCIIPDRIRCLVPIQYKLCLFELPYYTLLDGWKEEEGREAVAFLIQYSTYPPSASKSVSQSVSRVRVSLWRWRD